MPMSRPIAEIEADIAAVRAARRAIMAGERIKEISRDSRRVVFETMTLAQADATLCSLERELEQVEAGETGRPRRRPIALGWRN